MGIHRNHAENKVSAGIFSSFLLFAAHVSGRETKSIELWQTHAGFYCPIGRGHVPRAIFDCQTMTSVVEILIHWVLFHAQRRIYVFRDYIPGQHFVVGRKFSLAALDIVKFQPFFVHFCYSPLTVTSANFVLDCLFTAEKALQIPSIFSGQNPSNQMVCFVSQIGWLEFFQRPETVPLGVATEAIQN